MPIQVKNYNLSLYNKKISLHINLTANEHHKSHPRWSLGFSEIKIHISTCKSPSSLSIHIHIYY